MASLKAFRPFASQDGTSGRVTASPRSACGRTLDWAVQASRAWSFGKLLGDQSGHRHDVPLQPLGLVRGQDLDRVLAARQGVVQALLVLRGGTQEAEEGQQRGLAVERREAGRYVQEVAEGLAAAGGQRVRGRGEFDLEAGGGQDAVQDVHQGVGQ